MTWEFESPSLHFLTGSSVSLAEIAQLVEHNLAKVGVASSSLVFRSDSSTCKRVLFFYPPGSTLFYEHKETYSAQGGIV